MVIEVVASEVSKNGTIKRQTRYTALIYSMRAHLHKGIFTSGIHHLRQ